MDIHDDPRLSRLLGRAAELQEQAAAQTDDPPEAPADEPNSLAELKAAAAEAGIDERFVALAALELAASPVSPRVPTAAERRRAVRWLGAREPALTLAHRLHGPIDRVLAALGATLQAPRYGLRITDSTSDPRRGGTMLLGVPEFTTSVTSTGGLNLFAYYLRGVFDIEQIRLTLASRGDDHDVNLAVDLAQAWPSMSAWGLGLSAVAGALGGLLAWTLAAKLAVSQLLALPGAAAVAALLTWCGLLLMRRWYASATAQVHAQLRELLRDVDGALRSQAVFGVLPPTHPAPRVAAEADVTPVLVDS